MTRNIFLTIVLVLTIAMAPGLALGQPQQMLSGKLVVEGTGDSQELMRALARRFESLHPGTTIEIPNGIGSRGGIIAVLDGRAKLARVSRPLNQNEQRPGVRYAVFAKSPVVLAIHPDVRLSEITSEQIVGIYSGKYMNWKQLGGTATKIHPLGRESTDPGRMAIGKYVSGFEDIEEPANKTYYTTSALVEAIERHPGTIGYAPMAMVKKTGLKVLKVDGVYPLVMNLRNGTYKMTIPLGTVYTEDADNLARAFADFLYSKDAQKIIIQFGCMPVKRR